MHDSEQQLSLYKLLVEESLGLMCIHDSDGVLLAVNPAVTRSLGYPQGEGIRRNLRDFLAASVRDLFDEYLRRILANGSDSGFMRLVAMDGSERVWSYRNVRYDEPGKPPVVLGHALDVTHEVATERTLRESQNALSRARDELAARVEERTAELRRANEQLRAEIDQRKLMEEELLRVRKLESLGVLAGGIAHNFNNLLTIIQGNTALAHAQTEPGCPLHEILQQTLSACDRAASLSSQLLTFSKGGSPVRKVGNVGGLLRELVSEAGAGSPVRFSLAIDPGLWSCEFDPSQMSQVFHNIFLNARQSMPSGGLIEVRAGNTAAGAGLPLSPGRYVLISVRDRGCGIPPEILPRIFDPYFTTRESGSGLGLGIAHAIVMKHRGYISVQSQVGAGTTVLIYLPASGQLSEGPAPPRSVRELSRPGSGRILVMDDEELIRTLLMKMLKRLGYEAEAARDGAEAIGIYRRAMESGKRFDAVIVDLTVPGGMGGAQAAAGLREMDPCAKILLSSGYSNDDTIADFTEHGFDGVLLKPWSPAQLSAALQGVLGKSSE